MEAAKVRIAAALALLGVGLGAFGAHALRETLEQSNHLDAWRTAVFYQIIHALVLLVLALSGRRQPVAWWCWLLGSLLFSSSIYGLCLLDSAPWLGPLTPLGGLLMMIGWLALIIRPPRVPPAAE